MVEEIATYSEEKAVETREKEINNIKIDLTTMNDAKNDNNVVSSLEINKITTQNNNKNSIYVSLLINLYVVSLF
jgi:hypothetical protein